MVVTGTAVMLQIYLDEINCKTESHDRYIFKWVCYIAVMYILLSHSFTTVC